MALTYSMLSQVQKDNAALINAALTKYGITNPYLVAGILAVVSKESQFIPIKELYTYKLPRLHEVFSASRLGNKSDAELMKLLKINQNGYVTDGVALFNLLYGGAFGLKLGNTQVGDGYKYRGRGFNQNTGRGNYEMISKRIGIDLVSFPDKMNEPAVAAEALASFFANGLPSGLKKYKVADQSKIDTLKKGNDIAYNINAGIGNNPASDTTGGYKQTLDSMSSYYKALGELKVTETQKKMGFGFLGLLLIGGGIYYYLKTKKII